jgi:plasmid stabilization system protein ParE
MLVEFHPEAADDARQTRLWYAERSSAAAKRFASELLRAQELAAALPSVGSLGVAGTRRVHLHGFPHSLVNRVGPDRVLSSPWPTIGGDPSSGENADLRPMGRIRPPASRPASLPGLVQS